MSPSSPFSASPGAKCARPARSLTLLTTAGARSAPRARRRRRRGPQALLLVRPAPRAAIRYPSLTPGPPVDHRCVCRTPRLLCRADSRRLHYRQRFLTTQQHRQRHLSARQRLLHLPGLPRLPPGRAARRLRGHEAWRMRGLSAPVVQDIGGVGSVCAVRGLPCRDAARRVLLRLAWCLCAMPQRVLQGRDGHGCGGVRCLRGRQVCGQHERGECMRFLRGARALSCRQLDQKQLHVQRRLRAPGDLFRAGSRPVRAPGAPACVSGRGLGLALEPSSV